MASRKNKSKKVNSLFNKRVYLIILGIIALAILIIISVPYLKEGIGAGQAIHVTSTGTVASVTSGQKITLDMGALNAVKGDSFSPKLSIDTAGKKIIQVDFKIEKDITIKLASITTLNNLKTISLATSTDPVNSIWGTDVFVSSTLGSMVPLASLNFVLECPTGTTCNVDTTKPFKLKEVYLIESSTVKYGPFEVSGSVNVVPACSDADLDKYGKVGTDNRGCLYNTAFDCDDTKATVYPTAADKCDGLDNDCNPATLDGSGETAPYNSKLQGVCYGNNGKQICTSLTTSGQIKWQESFLVPIANPLAVKLTNSTNGQEYQFNLYEPAGETKCDFWDNDCDGIVNDGLAGCSMGGGTTPIPTGLLPPGNAFYDYDATTGAFVAQLTDPRDVNIVTYLVNVRETANTLGDTGNLPMWFTFKGMDGWVCDSGIYYLKDSDGSIYKYDYQNNRLKTTYVAGTDTILKDGSRSVTC